MKAISLTTFLLTAFASGVAQAPGTAKWEAIAQPANKQGVFVVNVTAQIQQGWHIYALSQPASGPIPLRITLEPGSSYELTGSITGTVPQKRQDASFDLETQFYTDTFTLKVPVRATSVATASVPLAVRYQMCSETICMPPKTIHVTASTATPSASLPL
jgi:DsbC/DsbD-like thiol-disulfide interchange protein